MAGVETGGIANEKDKYMREDIVRYDEVSQWMLSECSQQIDAHGMGGFTIVTFLHLFEIGAEIPVWSRCPIGTRETKV